MLFHSLIIANTWRYVKAIIKYFLFTDIIKYLLMNSVLDSYNYMYYTYTNKGNYHENIH